MPRKYRHIKNYEKKLIEYKTGNRPLFYPVLYSAWINWANITGGARRSSRRLTFSVPKLSALCPVCFFKAPPPANFCALL